MTILTLSLLFMVAAEPELKATINPDPKSLVVTPEQTEQALAVIAKMGSREYIERDEATRELREMGRTALPALETVLEQEVNPEIRLRCEMVLPHATADDIKARLDCFLADKDAKYDHKLPGAKEFFAITGKNEAARNLFRDIALSPQNRPILFAVGGDRNQLARVVQEQRGQFVNVPRKVVIIGGVVQQQNPKTADLLDITTLLFAESFLPDQGSQRISGVGSVSYMLSQPVFRDALAEGAKNREPLLALVGKWIDTRQDAYTLYTAMNAAQSLKLPHLLPICRKLVDPKTTGPGIYRAMAMTNLAKLGTVKDDLPILEKAFDDATVATTVFINNNKRQQVLMKDLALAMALIMSKQDPIAYGMKSRYSQNNESLKYNYSNYYFDDDEAKADETRKTAFEKYKKWKADQEKNEKK